MEERFGTWQLGRRVAVGDYADVTAVTRTDEEAKPVALKRLHAHTAREPEMKALFIRECGISRSVPEHPGLVRGLDSGEVDGRPWLTMPLIEGFDLRRRIDGGTPPDRARMVSIVRELCSALSTLHQAGWIHGDVTPSNILVGGHALLCDFGVARPPGEPGPVRGTHAYMAPEQVRGEPWTPATDVFALGVVLWELSAGTRLFLRGAKWLTMSAVVEDEPPPLADPAIARVVERALSKDPAGRFSTPAELAAAL